MTGLASAIQSFIADGFADDCEELIHQCLQETPVSFNIFCKVFKKMQMSCIYHDRHSGAEIAELSEEVINIAKYYMFADTSNFEETVIGLFLVYALVSTQPFPNFAYLRLVAEDVPVIERIEQIARRDKRSDVLYVLGRVLVEYTRYHAAARERAMEGPYRKYVQGSAATIDAIGLRPKGVFLRQNEEMEIIKELCGLQLRYDATKADMKALKYTDSKLPKELETSLKNLMSGIINEGGEDNVPMARTIKEKAMKRKVDGIKHLIALNERKLSPTTSKNASYKSDIKSSPGKVKSNLRKIGPPTLPARRPRYESSSSEETTDSDDDDDSESADIDVKLFNKLNKDNDNFIEVDSTKVKFEKLPPVTKCNDNGQLYEIEFIDNTNNENKGRTKRQRTVSNSIEIEVPGEEKFNKRSKKSSVQSRFKRMGIDTVADMTNKNSEEQGKK